ncbi:MAG: YceK/YidQ family lipoprotein [Verrucomicrobiota bacterium]
MKIRLAVVLVIALICCSGCGTVITHTVTKPSTTPAGTGTYRGTQTDTWLLCYTMGVGSQHWTEPTGWALMFSGLFVACDIALSAVADTLIWPYDITTPSSTGWPHGAE